jgi:hypothetical protein
MWEVQSKLNMPANMSTDSAVNKDTWVPAKLWAFSEKHGTRWYTEEYINLNRWNSILPLSSVLCHRTKKCVPEKVIEIIKIKGGRWSGYKYELACKAPFNKMLQKQPTWWVTTKALWYLTVTTIA